MHYLLGLAALVMGAVIATRRARPTWFVVLTSVLVGLGALLAILSYTRVTDSLGLLANNVIGWTFVGLSIITMLSSVFVLERRGEHGEELPPLIGDNPFDGDTDDSDDPAVDHRRATAHDGAATAGAPRAADRDVAATAVGAPWATSQDGVLGSDADVMAGDAAAPIATDGVATLEAALSEPSNAGRAAAPTITEGTMTDSTTPDASHGDADAEARADGTAAPSHPGPSAGAEDGTAVVGADPDIATSPADTDVDASPEGDVGAHDPDGTARA